MLLLALLPSLLPDAHAFCGTYVGPVGSSLENNTAQVIIARDGEKTVLTLANDYSGSVTSFGIVIPVPEVLTLDDVSLPDPELFAAFDLYAAPRIVSYTCDQLHGTYDYDYAASSADDSGAASGDPADGVVVESEFSLGEYDIVVLSATGAEGLTSWLDDNGFVMSDEAEPVIQDYIDQGQYFLAAKVDLDDLPAGQTYLSPLQFRYESAAFGLPIRIGTTVSPGEQEVVVHFINSSSDGKIAISNYPEVTIDDECMMPEDVTDYHDFYASELDDLFAGGIWTTEYAWDLGSCDPCSAEPPTEDQLIAAGATWSDPSWGTYITRLRLRYSPDEATQDLMFYTSGIQESSQVRYIEYVHELESDFPVCGVGMVENPGECDNTGYGYDDDTWPFGGTGGTGGTSDPEDDEEVTVKDDEGLCAVASGPQALALLLGVGALVRRRRASTANPA